MAKRKARRGVRKARKGTRKRVSKARRVVRRKAARGVVRRQSRWNATISSSAIQRIADDIRDMHNWIAVFDTEYDLPREVVNKLRSKLEKIARTLGTETL